MTTPDQIAAEIAEKAEKATPGPWEIERIDCYQYEDHLVGAEIVGRNRGTMVAEIRGAIEIYGKRHSENAANAELIAAANPANLKVLLADRAALLAKCERYRDALEAIEDHTETDMDTGETGLSEAAQIARTALTEAP